MATIFCMSCSNISSTTTETAAVNDADINAAENLVASVVVSIETVDQSSVNGSNSTVKFVVSNTTQDPVSWLSWNTPFEKPLSANIFLVSLNGKQRDYQGRLIKRGVPTPEQYMIIPASDSVQTIIDIGDYYDMDESGTYTVQLDSLKLSSAQQAIESPEISVSQSVVKLDVP